MRLVHHPVPAPHRQSDRRRPSRRRPCPRISRRRRRVRAERDLIPTRGHSALRYRPNTPIGTVSANSPMRARPTADRDPPMRWPNSACDWKPSSERSPNNRSAGSIAWIAPSTGARQAPRIADGAHLNARRLGIVAADGSVDPGSGFSSSDWTFESRATPTTTRPRRTSFHIHPRYGPAVRPSQSSASEGLVAYNHDWRRSRLRA